jgi:ankyrin repeat protein
LEKRHEDVEFSDSKGRTPLIIAVWEAKMDIVTCLLEEFEADIEVHDCNGKRPLHYASKLDIEEMVEYFVGPWCRSVSS